MTDEINYSEYVPLLKIIADETRLKIIGRLSKGSCCACELLEELNVTQPTLSYHMKILTQCELVIGKKNGIWMRYRLNPEKSKGCSAFMQALLCQCCEPQEEASEDVCGCESENQLLKSMGEKTNND